MLLRRHADIVTTRRWRYVHVLAWIPAAEAMSVHLMTIMPPYLQNKWREYIFSGTHSREKEIDCASQSQTKYKSHFRRLQRIYYPVAVSAEEISVSQKDSGRLKVEKKKRLLSVIHHHLSYFVWWLFISRRNYSQAITQCRNQSTHYVDIQERWPSSLRFCAAAHSRPSHQKISSRRANLLTSLLICWSIVYLFRWNISRGIQSHSGRNRFQVCRVRSESRT